MSRDPLKSQTLKIWLAIVWLFFTLAMVLWWWSLGISEMKAAANPPDPSRYRMMMSEGIFFFIATLAGGISLLVLLIKEQARAHQVKTFFATFSHDLKTSMARLRLQADVLREKSSQQKDPSLERLAKDISRLDLQLENSLIFSQGALSLLVEDRLPLSHVIESLRNEWENLDISLEKEAWITADRRAISSVFRNLIQNAVVHGSAEKISIRPQEKSPGKILIQVTDNGQGFSGDLKHLGQSPMPWREGSGNGIGLFLCRSLLSRQNGDLSFAASPQGFVVQILIPGGLTT